MRPPSRTSDVPACGLSLIARPMVSARADLVLTDCPPSLLQKSPSFSQQGLMDRGGHAPPRGCMTFRRTR